MADDANDIDARLKRFDQRIEEAKAAVLELHAILAQEACDHRPGFLHWVGVGIDGRRALIWCRCGALGLQGSDPVRLPMGKPVLIESSGKLQDLPLSWLLPGTLEPERAEQQTIMGTAEVPKPITIKAHFFFPGARIRVVQDDFGRLQLNALGTVIGLGPKRVKIRLDSGWEGEADIDDLEPVNTATEPEPRVPAPSLQELQEHWDGCAGAEAVINDLRAQTEVLAKLAPEFVICAALRLPDGRVLRCHRHHHGIPIALRMLELDPEGEAKMRERVDQGFVTSTGRYVGREEALQLQMAAGIPSVAEGGYRPPGLFSEDLY